MAGLGMVVGGLGAGGFTVGATTSALRNRDDGSPDWTTTKIAAAATVGLVAIAAACAFGRGVPALEYNLPLAEIGSLAFVGSFAGAGVTAGSLGANLLDG